MFGRVAGEKEGEAIKDVLRTYNPSKRIAEPLEIAKLAVYLASGDSAYVVGADFAIEGGAGDFSQLGGRLPPAYGVRGLGRSPRLPISRAHGLAGGSNFRI